LEKLKVDLQAETEQIDADRVKLTMQMKELEARLMELRLEAERIKNIKGDFVTSEV